MCRSSSALLLALVTASSGASPLTYVGIGSHDKRWFATPSAWSGNHYPSFPDDVALRGDLQVRLTRAAPHAAWSLALEDEGSLVLDEEGSLVLGDSDATCAPGTFSDGNAQCAPCPLGHHQPTAGEQGACLACAPGRFADVVGLRFCKDVPAGQQQPGTGQSGYEVCPVGHYANTPGTATCSPFVHYVGASGGFWFSAPADWNIKEFPTSPATIMVKSQTVELHRQAPHAADTLIIGQDGVLHIDGGGDLILGESSLECAAGHFYDTTNGKQREVCEPCAAGRHQELPSQETCHDCMAGHFQLTTGATGCQACDFHCGAGSDLQGCALGSAGSCLGCAPGTVKAAAGVDACTACAPGSAQAGTGALACTTCAVGRFQSTAGEPSCEPCAAGQFASSTGAAACSPCAVGSYSAAGAGKCTTCAAGKHQNQLGQTACTACAAGTYVAVTGSTACTDCAAGKFQSTAGAADCEACNYHCGAGTRHQGCGLSQPGTCVGCAAGSFKPTAGDSACSLCATGRSQGSTGASQCDDCAATTFQDEGGKASCKACEPHCKAGDEHTGCAGSVPGSCTACEAGSSKGIAGKHECDQCLAGRFHEGTGSLDCKDCPSGKFVSIVAATKCLDCDYLCSAGEYHAGCGSDNPGGCLSCGTGQYKPSAGTGGCTQCISGRFQASPRSTSCDACATHTFEPAEGSAACKACDYVCQDGSSHTACGGANGGTCEACPSGQYKSALSIQLECAGFCTSSGIKSSDANGQCVCNDGKSRFAAAGGYGCRSCAAGTVAPATGTTACRACDGHTEWQDEAGTTTCKAARVCTATEWESKAATPTSNRECREQPLCTITQWEHTPAGTHTKRICLDHTTCTSTQWRTLDAGTHHDRVCQDHTTCTATQWETRPAGTLHDRVCQDHTTCTSTQWETVNGGEYNDRVCEDHTTCTTTQWAIVRAEGYVDRVCKAHTTCTNEEFEHVAAGTHHDRVCKRCDAEPECPRRQKRVGCGGSIGAGKCVFNCDATYGTEFGNCYDGPSAGHWFASVSGWSLAHFPAYPGVTIVDKEATTLVKRARGTGKALVVSGTRVRIDAVELQVGHTECDNSERVLTAHTASSDAVCQAQVICTPGQWETRAATHLRPRVCQDHTVCTLVQWETKAPGTHHDRTCATHSDCDPGSYEVKAIGTHHDRECQSCAPGQFTFVKNLLTCNACPAGQFQDATGSTACVKCSAGKFRNARGAHNGESDSCTACPAGEYQDTRAQLSCSKCSVGKFRNSDAASLAEPAACTACPTGQHQDGQGQVVCDKCAAGTYRNGSPASGAAAAACSACQSGKYQHATGQVVCIKCQAGKFRNTNDASSAEPTACSVCQTGKYQPAAGELACISCTKGRFRTSAAPSTMVAAACSACPAGEYNDKIAQMTCVQCATGKLRNTLAASSPEPTACTVCPAAEYQDHPAQLACIKCMAGKYRVAAAKASSPEPGACQTCPTGEYSPVSGVLSCSKCAAGKLRNTSATSSTENVACTACAQGQYQDNTGQLTCVKCSAGKFRTTAVASSVEGTACAACATGQYQSKVAQMACVDCATHDYQDETGRTACKACDYHCAGGEYHTTCAGPSPGTCEPCKQGTFKPLVEGMSHGHNPQCDDCAPGTFADVTGHAVCKDCATGQFQDSHAKLQCKDCATGQYQDSTGNAECANCWQGQYADVVGLVTCKHCEPGRHFNGRGALKCKNCEQGRFQLGTGFHLCDQCAKGRYTDQREQIACKHCPTGKYQPLDGTNDCHECAVGDYQSKVGQAACVECEEHKFQPSKGKPGCKACDYSCRAGEYHSFCGVVNDVIASTKTSVPGQCDACPAGRHKSLAGVHGCSACAPGHYGDVAGLDNCKAADGITQFQPLPGQTDFKTIAICSATQYETRAPTADADRECATHVACSPTEWETRAASDKRDRVCVAHTVCDLKTHYVITKAGTHRNRVCAAQKQCQAGERMVTDATEYMDRVCTPCEVNTFKPVRSNARACAACPAGFVARPDRRSCFANQCSHVLCRHEKHSCSRHNKDPALRGFFGSHAHEFMPDECDGRTHESIRVFHRGMHTHLCKHNAIKPYNCPMLEYPCRNGHFCAMGAVSGDTNKCECRPTEHVPDFPATQDGMAVECTGGRTWNPCAKCKKTCSRRNCVQDFSTTCSPRCECPSYAPYWHNGQCLKEVECPADTSPAETPAPTPSALQAAEEKRILDRLAQRKVDKGLPDAVCDGGWVRVFKQVTVDVTGARLTTGRSRLDEHTNGPNALEKLPKLDWMRSQFYAGLLQGSSRFKINTLYDGQVTGTYTGTVADATDFSGAPAWWPRLPISRATAFGMCLKTSGGDSFQINYGGAHGRCPGIPTAEWSKSSLVGNPANGPIDFSFFDSGRIGASSAAGTQADAMHRDAAGKAMFNNVGITGDKSSGIEMFISPVFNAGVPGKTNPCRAVGTECSAVHSGSLAVLSKPGCKTCTKNNFAPYAVDSECASVIEHCFDKKDTEPQREGQLTCDGAPHTGGACPGMKCARCDAQPSTILEYSTHRAKEGYNHVTNSGLKCVDFIQYCVNFNEDGTCSRCLNNYAPWMGGTLCKVVVPFCFKRHTQEGQLECDGEVHVGTAACNNPKCLQCDNQPSSDLEYAQTNANFGMNHVSASGEKCVGFIQFCKEYSEAGDCLTCYNNYAPSADKKSCGVIVEGCHDGTLSASVLRCGTGLHDGKACAAAHCDTCQNQPLANADYKSAPAAAKLHRSASGKVCVPFITHCNQYGDDGACTGCINNWAPAADGKSCAVAIEHCFGASSTDGNLDSNGRCTSCKRQPVAAASFREPGANSWHTSQSGLHCAPSIKLCREYDDDARCTRCFNAFKPTADGTACEPLVTGCFGATETDGELLCAGAPHAGTATCPGMRCSRCTGQPASNLAPVAGAKHVSATGQTCVAFIALCSSYNDDGTCMRCINNYAPSTRWARSGAGKSCEVVIAGCFGGAGADSGQLRCDGTGAAHTGEPAGQYAPTCTEPRCDKCRPGFKVAAGGKACVAVIASSAAAP
jgi:hypothetical protein